MKIYPVNTAQKSTFKGRMFTVKKFKSDTKDFFEAAGVVCLTSIPMFLYIAGYHLYERYFKNKTS